MHIDHMKKTFTEDEQKKLKAFFVLMFKKCRYEEYGSLECKTADDYETLIFYWDASSLMGWHDESYHDATKFTLTKDIHKKPECCEDANDHHDIRIRFIAKHADNCGITKHTQSEEFRFDHDEYVLSVEGFLNIPEVMTIVYSYARGEW